MTKIDDFFIVDRAKNPRFKGTIGQYTCMASGSNAFCGDSLTVELFLDHSSPAIVVSDATYDGFACSLCIASADVLCEKIIGKGLGFISSISLDDVLLWLGGLEAGVTRKKCILLPLELIKEATETEGEQRNDRYLE